MKRITMLTFGLGMLAGASVAVVPFLAPLAAQSGGLAKPEFTSDDAGRAAATRLLAASRFRERQEVLMAESLRVAQSDLTADCVDRAAAGRDVGDCRATHPDAAMKARLVAGQSDMLDEVMAASQTIYTRHFTAPEMDEITRFFRTPVGQKYSAQYPSILGEVQARKRAILRRYLIGVAGEGGGRGRPGIAHS